MDISSILQFSCPLYFTAKNNRYQPIISLPQPPPHGQFALDHFAAIVHIVVYLIELRLLQGPHKDPDV
jgi:hypothetical protein